MIFLLLNFLFISCVVVFGVTQLILPILYDTPLFPIFRRHSSSRKEVMLQELQRMKEENELQKICEERERIEQNMKAKKDS